MISFRFTLEDLAQTRFAISPMWELVSGLRALRDPAKATHHLPWITEALPIARGLDLDGAIALTPTDGYIPDFITPPPSGPLARFDDELELVRATSAKQIRIDIERLKRDGRNVPALDAFLDRPRQEVGRMCDALAELWHLALEPHWKRIRSVLQDDLRYRAGRLTDGGPARLFSDLNPGVNWDGGLLVIPDACRIDLDVELAGRGLLLVPSAFWSTRPGAITEAPWQPTVLYPSRGIGLLWETQPDSEPGALKRLIGGTRSQLLVALGSPRSTTDLSRTLGVSAGGVSQHLSVLRESGLVRSEREGRLVLYMRTELADSLVD